MFWLYFPWFITAVCLAGVVIGYFRYHPSRIQPKTCRIDPTQLHRIQELARHTVSAQLKRKRSELIALATAAAQTKLADTVRLQPEVDQKDLAAVLQALNQRVATQVATEFSGCLTEPLYDFSKIVNEGVFKQAREWANSRSTHPTMAIQPPGTIYAKRCGRMTTMAIQEEPTTRTVYFFQESSGMEDDKYSWYTLSLPYLIYILVFLDNRLHSLNVCCRTTPVTTLQDQVYNIPLPNVDEEGKACMGEIDLKVVQDPFLLAPKMVAAFWSATFNSEMELTTNNVTADERLATLASWETASSQNQDFILDCRFRECGSLMQMIDYAAVENHEWPVDEIDQDELRKAQPERDFASQIQKTASDAQRTVKDAVERVTKTLSQRCYPGTTEDFLASLAEVYLTESMETAANEAVAEICRQMLPTIEEITTDVVNQSISTATKEGDEVSNG